MPRRKWNDGPPPSIGWWLANANYGLGALRWWNGEHWSVPAYPSYSAAQAAECASIQSISPNPEIRWRNCPGNWEWFDGPPPSIGWWPAGAYGDYRELRWWDGKCWSKAPYWNYNEPLAEQRARAAQYALLPAEQQANIRWTHRPANWPAASYT